MNILRGRDPHHYLSNVRRERIDGLIRRHGVAMIDGDVAAMRGRQAVVTVTVDGEIADQFVASGRKATRFVVSFNEKVREGRRNPQ